MEATLQPRDLAEALAARAAHPGALPLAGGTDLMVDLNFDRLRPARIMDLNRVRELEGWERDGDDLVIGAGVTHTRLVDELAADAPGLAIAARSIGAPQIRNRGTIGGNIATASPAGDVLPPLIAAGAAVELAGAAGRRTVPLAGFCTGPKRNVLADTELITAVRVPAARGPQQFAKVGPRNAMVIAVCSLALQLDPVDRRVGAAIGSGAPTVIRAEEAERFLEGALEEAGLWGRPGPVPESVATRFGELVAAAALPIDDVRGSAAYRRHALGVLARRTLGWCRGAAA